MPLGETRTSRFIDALVEDLAPVRPARRLSETIFVWGAISLPWVLLPVLGHRGLRPGATEALLGAAPLAWETMAGTAAASALLGVGLEIGVPGARPARVTAPLLLFLGGIWLGLVLTGDPVVGEGPMPLGKRPHCFLEAIGLSTLPFALALAFLSRRATRSQARAGALLGAASACLPALAMQLACMDDPGHAARYHLTPVLLASGLGALSGAAVGALRAQRAHP